MSRRIYGADIIRASKDRENGVTLRVLDAGRTVQLKPDEDGQSFTVGDVWVTKILEVYNDRVVTLKINSPTDFEITARAEPEPSSELVDERMLEALLRADATRKAFEARTGTELDLITWKIGGTFYLGKGDLDL